MKRMSKGLPAVVLTCLLQLLLVQVSRAEVVDRIVAEVNDEIITMSELQAASKSIEAQTGVQPKGKESKEIERQMLEALIDRKLAKAEAKRRGIKIEDKELEIAVANFKRRNHFQDEEAFKNALSKAGLTLKELKQNIADQMIQSRLISLTVGAKIVVNEADVRRAYEEHYKDSGGVRLHLRNLQMPFPPDASEAQKEEMKKKAEAILAEVKNGASFSDAARKFSLTENDVGFVSESDLEPKLAEFLGRLKPKEVAPAMTPQGIQLIQLVERRAGKGRSFEEAAPEIRRALTDKEMEKHFSGWVKTLRQKAHIKIML